MATPWWTSSAVMTHGGQTCVRFMWMNGHRPAVLHAWPNSAIGAAAGPLALKGTSGSRVDRSRTSSSAQNTPSPRTSPTEGWLSASSRSAGPITVSPSSRTCSRIPSSRKMRIEATAVAQASGWPE
jgi:hypothetical protein